MKGGQTAFVRTVTHPSIDLGSEYDLLAASPSLSEPPTDNLLRPPFSPAPPVDIGRIEEANPEAEGLFHDGVAVLFTGHRTEVHGPETEAADLQAGAPQLHIIHLSRPPRKTFRRSAGHYSIFRPPMQWGHPDRASL